MCATQTIPMCWKCAKKITVEPVGHVGLFDPKDLIGCTANDYIFTYDDAQTMCPLDLHGN